MQLAGLIPVLTGEISWQGKAGLPVRSLFYVAHQLGIHLQLTVEQNLRFLLALYGIKPSADAPEQALDWVGLAGYEKINCYQLSAGQTRRVGLARLLFALEYVAQFPCWLLDEPLTALDVNMIAKIEHDADIRSARRGSAHDQSPNCRRRQQAIRFNLVYGFGATAMIDFSALWQREWQIKQKQSAVVISTGVVLIIITLFPLAMGRSQNYCSN